MILEVIKLSIVVVLYFLFLIGIIWLLASGVEPARIIEWMLQLAVIEFDATAIGYYGSALELHVLKEIIFIVVLSRIVYSHLSYHSISNIDL